MAMAHRAFTPCYGRGSRRNEALEPEELDLCRVAIRLCHQGWMTKKITWFEIYSRMSYEVRGEQCVFLYREREMFAIKVKELGEFRKVDTLGDENVNSGCITISLAENF